MVTVFFIVMMFHGRVNIILKKNSNKNNYNFSEFKFIGDEPRIRLKNKYKALSLDSVVFLKQAYFTGSSFVDALELNEINFKDGADFSNTVFSNDITIKNSNFHGATFDE